MIKDTKTQLLVDYIEFKGYATYEEVEAQAKEIDPLWRSETWRRSLRRRKDVKAVYRLNNPLLPIIAYESLAENKPYKSRAAGIQTALL